MEIKELAEKIYAQAVEKGLYKIDPGPKRLLWHIHDEAQEAVEAFKHYKDLKSHYGCRSRYIGDCAANDWNCPKCEYRSNEGVPQELADVIIMTLSTCMHLGIDIEEAIEQKIAYNATRAR